MDDTIYIPRHRLDVGEMADLAFVKGWKRVLIYGLLASALIGFMVYTFFAAEFGLSIPAVVAIGLFIGLMAAYNSRRSTRAIYAKQAQSFAFEDRTIYFNQRAITVDYANGATSTFPWTCFLKLEFRPEFLLIYLTSMQYVTIPRRVLDERMENAIRSAMTTAQQQKGLLPPPPLS